MKQRFILIAALALLFACNKYDNIVDGGKQVPELLTERPWLIVGAGFDDNLNGIVDASENQLTDCQQDNTYIFNKGGNGAIQEGGIDCNPPSSLLFTWVLQNNDKEIVINHQPYFIVRVTDDELVLKADVPMDVDFLLRYTH